MQKSKYLPAKCKQKHLHFKGMKAFAIITLFTVYILGQYKALSACCLLWDPAYSYLGRATCKIHLISARKETNVQLLKLC